MLFRTVPLMTITFLQPVANHLIFRLGLLCQQINWVRPTIIVLINVKDCSSQWSKWIILIKSVILRAIGEKKQKNCVGVWLLINSFIPFYDYLQKLSIASSFCECLLFNPIGLLNYWSNHTKCHVHSSLQILLACSSALTLMFKLINVCFVTR